MPPYPSKLNVSVEELNHFTSTPKHLDHCWRDPLVKLTPEDTITCFTGYMSTALTLAHLIYHTEYTLSTYKYPTVSTGVADSCAGNNDEYTFPNCSNWDAASATDDADDSGADAAADSGAGESYYYKDIEVKHEQGHDLSYVYTAIAGVHSGNGTMMERSLSCRVINQTENGFVIRMQTRSEVY